ncbi:Transcription termination factor 2 [Strongyloides ratti]|uniref:Transcription termination factor 2 n=1 Tax=Strongyloides ratti TaxID=34506 RepID=A0A090MVY7_STRRB|nr:Transcription termination factor 2 [Strongyloides ratti]CEF63228.1 Transcription termination factor 2 [Strongyloides ratti]
MSSGFYEPNLLNSNDLKGSRNDPIIISEDSDDSDSSESLSLFQNVLTPDVSKMAYHITDYFEPLPDSFDGNKKIISNKNNCNDHSFQSIKRQRHLLDDEEIMEDGEIEILYIKKTKLNDDTNEEDQTSFYDKSYNTQFQPIEKEGSPKSNNFFTKMLQSYTGDLFLKDDINRFSINESSISKEENVNVSTEHCFPYKFNESSNSLKYEESSSYGSFLVQKAASMLFNKNVNNPSNQLKNNLFDEYIINKKTNDYGDKGLNSPYFDYFCNGDLTLERGIDFVDGNEVNFKEKQLQNYRSCGKLITLNDVTIGNIISLDTTKETLKGRKSELHWGTISSNVNDLFKTILDFLEHYDKKLKIETPSNFRGNLKPYQEEGLAFLVKRENSFPCGGILADDMGLGKTAQMISLILHQKNLIKDSELEGIRVRAAKARHLLPINATLIIATTGLIGQWKSEIEKFAKHGQLNVGIFHGTNRTTNHRDLESFDVILTSYGVVLSELRYLLEDSEEEDDDRRNNKSKKKNKTLPLHFSVLTKVCFQRIILDEAHSIKNRKSLVSKACMNLSGLRRWCVTGTPIHNDLWDAFSLFRFLRTYPLDQEYAWKNFISTLNKHGLSRLEILVEAILLRRTKDQHDEDDMDPRERVVYDQMFKAAQEFVRSFLEKCTNSDIDCGNPKKVKNKKNLFLNATELLDDCENRFQNMACILAFLLRLRQACNHMFLTKSGLDLSCLDGGEDINMKEKISTAIKDSLDIFTTKNYNKSNNKNKHLEVFEDSFISSKLLVLLERIDKILEETDDKIIVVSQWTSMLRLIHPHLKKRQIDFVEITGEVDSKVRQLAQNDINNCEINKRIMLLSLNAGGLGLNLIGANHIFILDPHWNPFMEDQACDRIYRIGQSKNVFINKFICKNTIEQRVLHLQGKKRELSNTFLKKTGNKKEYKLTNEDLAYLFEVK